MGIKGIKGYVKCECEANVPVVLMDSGEVVIVCPRCKKDLSKTAETEAKTETENA
jgi:uncharacterized paraquat-inducible protein A